MPARRTVVALTAFALILRVATLDAQSLWSDEAATADVLRHPLGGMLEAVWDGESTPPLFYLLVWAWTQVAGTGEVALRLPSAVLGALGVPVVAMLAARVAAAGGEPAARRAAIAGALLAATGPLMVWYGQEARAYALLMLLAAGSALTLLRALDEPSGGRLAAWAALAVAAVWTHHFALFVVLAEAGWALWVLRGRALPAVTAVAAGVTALAPLLLHQRAAGRASFIADVALPTRLAQAPKQVLVGYDAPAEATLTVLGALATAAALAGLAARLRADGLPLRGRPPTAALVVLTVAAAGVLLPVAAAAVGQDFVLTRNLLGALPLLLALLAAGLAGPGRAAAVAAAGVTVLAAVGLTVAVAVAVRPAYGRDDFRGAVSAAVGGAQGPRLVITDGPGRVPALHYLGVGTRVAPPGVPVLVREIDVVRVAGAEPGRPRSTPALPGATPPIGFAPAGAATGDTWAVRRFVAPVPVPVDPGAVTALAAPAGRPVVLFRPR